MTGTVSSEAIEAEARALFDHARFTLPALSLLPWDETCEGSREWCRVIALRHIKQKRNLEARATPSRN